VFPVTQIGSNWVSEFEDSEGNHIEMTTAVASTGSAAWTDDGAAIPESADAFTQFNVKSYKLAALSRIKESFDLESYLSREFARRFGRAEEGAFLNGDGVNLPGSILSATGGTVGVTAADPAKIAYDEVVTLYFSLKAEYRENAVFLMHDETAMLLRTLKDTTGNYLWNASNDTIFSKSVVTSSHMPTIAAGAKSIVFGDLSYYWIVERQPLTIKVLSELYARQGQIGFSAFERLDGKLILPEAVKILQQAQ
jgi:HK97 family phage major capsid protein